MDLQQLISILFARKRTIFKVLACVVVIVTVASLLWPKTYTGIVTMVVNVKTPDPVTGMLTQGMILPSIMATQSEIITSERVGRRVVKMLGFEKVPELVDAWKEDTQGQWWWNNGGGTFEGYYAEKLGKKLKVEPSRDGDTIEIRFKADDPKTAAAIANAYAQAYLDTNLEIAIEPAKQYATWFVDQTKQIRSKMTEEQAKFTQYQKDKGIVSMDEKFDVEAAHLSDLAAQLTVLTAQQSDAEARLHDAATGKLDSIPDVVNNAEIQNLRVAITSADGKLLLAANTLGPNHPQIREQKAELDTLKSQLQSEMANIASSLKTNAQVTRQKANEIRAQMEAQRAHMLELKKQRDEAADMQADLAATQLDYNNLRQRLTQSNLQSQTPETDVTILTPAYEPNEPSRPKILLNILVSIFLGLVLGIGAAIVKEQKECPIRTEHDLAELGFPVLGILTVDRPVPRWQSWLTKWQFWRHQKALS